MHSFLTMPVDLVEADEDDVIAVGRDPLELVGKSGAAEAKEFRVPRAGAFLVDEQGADAAEAFEVPEAAVPRL